MVATTIMMTRSRRRRMVLVHSEKNSRNKSQIVEKGNIWPTGCGGKAVPHPMVARRRDEPMTSCYLILLLIYY